jgi:uncharacterized OB-fold protein
MSEPQPFPLPDSDSIGFWDACRRHELTVGHCPACGADFFYPRRRCPFCGGLAQLQLVSGRGSIYSWTRVHRAPPAFRDEAPYVVVLVELDEGPRLMSRLDVPGSVTPRVGDRLRVDFRDTRDGGFTLPWFVAEGRSEPPGEPR